MTAPHRPVRLAILAFVALGVPFVLLPQHSPAPDRPAEGAQRTAAPPTGPGPAPGILPPAPMDGQTFEPGPPPTPGMTPGEILPRVTRMPTSAGRVTPGPTPRTGPPIGGKAPARKTPPSGPTPVSTPVPTPAPTPAPRGSA